MLPAVLKIVALLAVVAIGGEFLAPPLSCWLAKGALRQEGGGGEAGGLLVQPGGGVGAAIRNLALPPPNLPGATCRATLLRSISLR